MPCGGSRKSGADSRESVLPWDEVYPTSIMIRTFLETMDSGFRYGTGHSICIRRLFSVGYVLELSKGNAG
jgi:hypothetical protein